MTEGEPLMRAHFKTRERAQTLRREMTKAEAILWKKLRGQQVFNARFRKQHPIDPYIADFVCAKAKLIIELDGETHSTAEERAHDARRTAFLENQGWRVVRFWNAEVYQNIDGVVATIEQALSVAFEGVRPE
jgi:very-short-patch-repair endonuclease